MKTLVLLICLAIQASASDLETVAATILGEARGEGKAGMYAVACIIQQRAIERKISPASVCIQRLQFSCNNKGVQTNLLKTEEGKYAIQLSQNLANLDRSFIGFSNHYHNSSVKPTWANGKSSVKKIGNHIFYKL